MTDPVTRIPPDELRKKRPDQEREGEEIEGEGEPDPEQHVADVRRQADEALAELQSASPREVLATAQGVDQEAHLTGEESADLAKILGEGDVARDALRRAEAQTQQTITEDERGTPTAGLESAPASTGAVPQGWFDLPAITRRIQRGTLTPEQQTAVQTEEERRIAALEPLPDVPEGWFDKSPQARRFQERLLPLEQRVAAAREERRREAALDSPEDIQKRVASLRGGIDSSFRLLRSRPDFLKREDLPGVHGPQDILNGIRWDQQQLRDAEAIASQRGVEMTAAPTEWSDGRADLDYYGDVAAMARERGVELPASLLQPRGAETPEDSRVGDQVELPPVTDLRTPDEQARDERRIYDRMAAGPEEPRTMEDITRDFSALGERGAGASDQTTPTGQEPAGSLRAGAVEDDVPISPAERARHLAESGLPPELDVTDGEMLERTAAQERKRLHQPEPASEIGKTQQAAFWETAIGREYTGMDASALQREKEELRAELAGQGRDAPSSGERERATRNLAMVESLLKRRAPTSPEAVTPDGEFEAAGRQRKQPESAAPAAASAETTPSDTAVPDAAQMERNAEIRAKYDKNDTSALEQELALLDGQLARTGPMAFSPAEREYFQGVRAIVADLVTRRTTAAPEGGTSPSSAASAETTPSDMVRPSVDASANPSPESESPAAPTGPETPAARADAAAKPETETPPDVRRSDEYLKLQDQVALEWMKQHDARNLEEHGYTGELDADGYFMKKDGTSDYMRPCMMYAGQPLGEILAQTDARLEVENPELYGRLRQELAEVARPQGAEQSVDTVRQETPLAPAVATATAEQQLQTLVEDVDLGELGDVRKPDGTPYTGKELRGIVDGVRSGARPLDDVPSDSGVRDRVRDILGGPDAFLRAGWLKSTLPESARHEEPLPPPRADVPPSAVPGAPEGEHPEGIPLSPEDTAAPETSGMRMSSDEVRASARERGELLPSRPAGSRSEVPERLVLDSRTLRRDLNAQKVRTARFDNPEAQQRALAQAEFADAEAVLLESMKQEHSPLEGLLRIASGESVDKKDREQIRTAVRELTGLDDAAVDRVIDAKRRNLDQLALAEVMPKDSKRKRNLKLAASIGGRLGLYGASFALGGGFAAGGVRLADAAITGKFTEAKLRKGHKILGERMRTDDRLRELSEADLATLLAQEKQRQIDGLASGEDLADLETELGAARERVVKQKGRKRDTSTYDAAREAVVARRREELVAHLRETGVDPAEAADTADRVSALWDMDERNTRLEHELYGKNPSIMKRVTDSKPVKAFGTLIGGGRTTKDKLTTAGVFTGLSLAAAKNGTVRDILMTYAGARLGSLGGEALGRKITKERGPITAGELGAATDPKERSTLLTRARAQLLDPAFRRGNVQEVARLQSFVDQETQREIQNVPDAERAGETLKRLSVRNDQQEREIQWEALGAKTSKDARRFMKVAGGILGGAVGFAAGEALSAAHTRAAEARAEHARAEAERLAGVPPGTSPDVLQASMPSPDPLRHFGKIGEMYKARFGDHPGGDFTETTEHAAPADTAAPHAPEVKSVGQIMEELRQRDAAAGITPDTAAAHAGAAPDTMHAGADATPHAAPDVAHAPAPVAGPDEQIAYKGFPKDIPHHAEVVPGDTSAADSAAVKAEIPADSTAADSTATKAAESAPASHEIPVRVETGPAVSTIEKATAGDNAWKMLERQLDKHGAFADLKGSPEQIAAQKTYVIDAFKDRVAANPDAFGFKDVDDVVAGKDYDFSSLFKEAEQMSDTVKHATELPADKIQSILEHDKNIREWVASHPGQRLTSEIVDDIARDGKLDAATVVGETNRIIEPHIIEPNVAPHEMVLPQPDMQFVPGDVDAAARNFDSLLAKNEALVAHVSLGDLAHLTPDRAHEILGSDNIIETKKLMDLSADVRKVMEVSPVNADADFGDFMEHYKAGEHEWDTMAGDGGGDLEPVASAVPEAEHVHAGAEHAHEEAAATHGAAAAGREATVLGQKVGDHIDVAGGKPAEILHIADNGKVDQLKVEGETVRLIARNDAAGMYEYDIVGRGTSAPDGIVEMTPDGKHVAMIGYNEIDELLGEHHDALSEGMQKRIAETDPVGRNFTWYRDALVELKRIEHQDTGELSMADASAAADTAHATAERLPTFASEAGRVEFTYDADGSVSGFKTAADVQGSAELLKDDFRARVIEAWEKSGRRGDLQTEVNKAEHTARMLSQQRDIFHEMASQGHLDTPEAQYLRTAIEKGIDRLESKYGDIIKEFGQ